MHSSIKHPLMWTVLLLVSSLAVAAGDKPATAPAMKSADLHGTWTLDKQATIDRAVASAPAEDKQRVKEELTQFLPAQSYTFNADNTYAVRSTPVGGSELSDSGNFTLADGKLRLVSTGLGGDRLLAVTRQGETIVLENMLVLTR